MVIRLFYLQCDEAIHENDLPAIQACSDHLNNKKVEGFLFNFAFWGDYQHYHNGHSCIKKK